MRQRIDATDPSSVRLLPLLEGSINSGTLLCCRRTLLCCQWSQNLVGIQIYAAGLTASGFHLMLLLLSVVQQIEVYVCNCMRIIVGHNIEGAVERY